MQEFFYIFAFDGVTEIKGGMLGIPFSSFF